MSPLPKTYKRVYLAERPKDGPLPALTFTPESLPLSTPKSSDEVLVKVEYVSLDPAMRGWLKDVRSYVPPVKIGETMRAGGLGRVIIGGKTLKFGDLVFGNLGWAEYALLKEKDLRKISPPEGTREIDYLGPLGASGMTAYFGLLQVGFLKPKETLVVSGAAGSVGSLVCQIGVLKGARVIALAGSDEKCEWLEKELGVDKALNYKKEGFRKTFRESVGYLDVFFDNVGGEILDLALSRLNRNARVVLCGAISDYNNPNPKGPKNYMALISQRARMEGFIVFDYTSQFPAAEREMAEWLKQGKIGPVKYHVEKGIEKCASSLGLLFEGKNHGKLLVKVSKDEEGGVKSRL